MAKFKKKVIEVEAEQFWPNGPQLSAVNYEDRQDIEGRWVSVPYVTTIHGQRAYLAAGDWIIREPDGEHWYPCKPEIFVASYEAI